MSGDGPIATAILAWIYSNNLLQTMPDIKNFTIIKDKSMSYLLRVGTRSSNETGVLKLILLQSPAKDLRLSIYRCEPTRYKSVKNVFLDP